ncbi:MAG: DEAD/DEAH box helicase [Verrucomicrobia bacterium]|nr:DEAD/DEAH box helicase [Verrucomicrobiota bacterium]
MTPKLFSELGLSAEVLKAIDKLGFEQASPIQAEAIPVLMQGRDAVGQSQTGSGKTAAFGIPAVEKIDPRQRLVQVLVLCPTRELAVQVSEEIHKLAFFKRGIHALPIYGGQSYERQFWGLKQGAQIVIGTPGRVMDHMRRGTLRLETVKMVILDEADVMLDMGFREDIEFILQAVPAERQTVFFCATLPRPILDLIQKYARDPQSVRIEQKTLTVPTVEQVYYEVDRRFKLELLTRLIDIHDLRLGIIFCNTKRMVDDLVDHLEAQGYSADRLHGDMSQAMRDRVMNKFRKSGLEFLVATDVAARGIDVDDVQVVFNYDLPYDAEDYVHRIGRTGRAGRSGLAVSFVAGREVFQIRHIERYTNMRIRRARVPTAGEVEEARTSVFLDKLRATLQSGEFERHDRLIERLLEEGFSSTDVASALIHHLHGGDAAATPRPAPERAPHREPRADRDEPWRDRPRRGDDRWERPAREPQRMGRSDRPVAEDRRPPARPPAPRPERRPEAVPADAPLQASAPVVPPPELPVAPSVVPDAASVVPVVASTPAVQLPPSPPLAESPAPASPPPPPRPGPAAARPERLEKPPARPAKASRPTPEGQTRLHMNVGAEMGIAPIDIVNTIAGETGLPGKVVGTVDIRERHLFADVATEHVHGIVAKLNRTQIKGHRLKVKVA